MGPDRGAHPFRFRGHTPSMPKMTIHTGRSHSHYRFLSRRLAAPASSSVKERIRTGAREEEKAHGGDSTGGSKRRGAAVDVTIRPAEPKDTRALVVRQCV